MIKAVFSDFYGTAVYENGPSSYEVIKRVYQNSRAASPEEVVSVWWNRFRQKTDTANGTAYRRQSELARESFTEVLEHFHGTEDVDQLCSKMEEQWSRPPLYADAEVFFASLSLPYYFITNSDDRFIQKAVKHLGLSPAGIFTSEGARFYKPHEEIFAFALSQTGLQPEEVVHIGDSLEGDVLCPASLGIRAIWLNREQRPVPDGVTAAADFAQVRQILNDSI